MKYKDWLTTTFDLEELIIGGSSICGRDAPQHHLIGTSPCLSGRSLSTAFNKVKELNSELCYCNVNEECGRGTHNRVKVLSTVYDYDFVTLEGFSEDSSLSPRGKGKLSFTKFFTSLLRHKFSISPEGNGVDCYRHYESLLAKSIPIILCPDDNYCQRRWGKTSQIVNKYKDLPVLYTHDYTELSEDYLNEKYAEILETDYNFDKLTLSYWANKSKNHHYWLTKTTRYWAKQHGRPWKSIKPQKPDNSPV